MLDVKGKMTSELANYLFDYNMGTGALTVSRNGEKHIRGKAYGDLVSTGRPHGYLSVKYNYKEYPTHRLIYFMVKGKYPIQLIHLNGNRQDNRWSNLQATTYNEKKSKLFTKPKITPEYLRTVFTYNKKTGKILRKGKSCGSLCKTHGYRQVKIHQKRVPEHRLAYMLVTGKEIPKGMVIDHVNRIKHDNRWCNLKLTTQAENNKNKSVSVHNTSGTVGVSYVKKSNKWKAVINVNGKHTWLGSFTSKEDAVKCRLDAEKLYGYTSGKAYSPYTSRSVTLTQSTPKWLDEDDKEVIKWIYDIAKERTLQYGIPFEVDHIIPLNGANVCGFHMPENLQVITRSENRSKNNKFEREVA